MMTFLAKSRIKPTGSEGINWDAPNANTLSNDHLNANVLRNMKNMRLLLYLQLGESTKCKTRFGTPCKGTAC